MTNTLTVARLFLNDIIVWICLCYTNIKKNSGKREKKIRKGGNDA